MKKRSASYLVVVLALIIANTGFARADAQLCRTSCEYSALSNTAIPPCCKSKRAVNPVMVVDAHDSSVPGDCPHLGSNREISDPLTFIAATNIMPVPPHVAAWTEIASMIHIPDSRFSGYYIRSGLSPPGRKIPPAYHINCSLLI